VECRQAALCSHPPPSTGQMPQPRVSWPWGVQTPVEPRASAEALTQKVAESRVVVRRLRNTLAAQVTPLPPSLLPTQRHRALSLRSV
jgi:hypothetical protein